MTKGTATSEKDIADAILTRLKHIKTVGSQWYVFKDGYWRESKRDTYRPMVYACTDESQWKSKLESSVLAQIEGRCQCDGSIFCNATTLQDDGTVAINVGNGIVVVSPDSIRLMEHNKEFYFTKCLNVNYDPGATCPRYEATFKQLLPDPEDRLLKQISYGNFFWPDARHEVVQIDLGEAGTGKSTLAEPIIELLGSGEEGLLTSLSLSQICDPKCYALAKLRFALVNLGTELQTLAIPESDNFKKIVSGEPFEVRPIYNHSFTMTTFPKLWFLANNIPRFKNGTDAELRRARFTIFDHKVTPSEMDRGLKSYLKEQERPGLFNFMLQGLQMLMQRGSVPLGGPKSRALHDRFRVSNDTIKSFVDDCCVLDPNLEVTKESLGNAYTEYCEGVSLPFTGDQHFFQKLYDRYSNLRQFKKRTEVTRVPSLHGIGLKQVDQSQHSNSLNDIGL